MIPHTLHKLEETRFFLGHLYAEDSKIVRNPLQAFKFYLSAFLSAARSVTFVLQKEAKASYDTFFPEWQKRLTQEERSLLEFMRDQRNFEMKELGATTETRRHAVPAELVHGFHVFGPPMATLGEEYYEEHLKRTRELGLPAWCRAWTYKVKHMFSGKKEPPEVIKEYEGYMALLDRLVQEFLASQSGGQPPINPLR